MKKYEINKFETPEKKSYKNLEKYDVLRFEFGDFDNWVTAIVLDSRIEEVQYGSEKVKHLVIDFETVSGNKQTCYETVYDETYELDIVGKATELVKCEEEDLCM